MHPSASPPTPYLAINETIVRRNVGRLAQYASQHRIALRPHTKTHKSVEFARMQLDAGARGLTVAKVGEAEVMAAVCDDLLLAYPAVDAPRTQRIAALAHKCKVHVAVDSAYAADAIASAAREAGSTVGILVDIDLGMHRTGVQSPQAALQLAQHVSRQPHLALRGLFCYPGHVAPKTQAQQTKDASALVRETLDLWKRHGLEAPIVSGGSTPTAFEGHLMPELTEVRPGTYIFNDMNTVLGGYCTLEDCAAVLVCTVVSDAVPGKVVIDAGSKTLSSDRNFHNADAGHGHVIGYPDAKITRLSEEHGEVDITNCPRDPRIGEQVRVIPNHICPCVNLQDVVWCYAERNDELRAVPVDARGKLS